MVELKLANELNYLTTASPNFWSDTLNRLIEQPDMVQPVSILRDSINNPVGDFLIHKFTDSEKGGIQLLVEGFSSIETQTKFLEFASKSWQYTCIQPGIYLLES